MSDETKITVKSSEDRRFPPPQSFIDKAYVKSHDERMKIWKESVSDPDKYWLDIANSDMFYWKKAPTKGFNWENKSEIKFSWFKDGKTNMAYNCLDKWVEKGKGDQIALIWQGDPLDEDKTYTFSQLTSEVSKAANVLKNLGVKKGDAITFYLPMIPELAILMLATARIGAVHSIVFGGFSADSLKDRISDCQSKLLITADGYYRNDKHVLQKAGADAAVADTSVVEKVLVVQRMGDLIETPWTEGRDLWYHEELAKVDDNCEPEWMDAEDPLFILYTSGSTGKPKGVLHTTGGYMVYTAWTFKNIFDYHDGDIYWCTADIGWITGHSYITYGPLAAGATTMMFEGT
ncbi:MAG: AMP-binding protein, partial [Candidatus Thorarchaeota archaeon]|nr:AMP-binding protein [Candidatus Thorarchaeota archaeon]